MTRTVLHRHIWKPGFSGGVVNTTLCGRVDNSSDYNIADSDEDVTCKFCRKLLGGATNYNSKWLNWQPPADR
ncbi:MAG: hypothetical protein ACR2OV_15975 [Hyphomicrobiaceae bacterium]